MCVIKKQFQNVRFLIKKRKKVSTLMLLFFMLFSIQSLAQHSLIDSVQLIPTHPVSNQTVKIVVHSWFSNSPANLDSTQLNQQGDTIMLTNYFFVSGYQSFYNRIDTFNVGMFTPGDYVLKIKSRANYFAFSEVKDSVYLNFTVGTLGVASNKLSPAIVLYPNPFSGTLHFSMPSIAKEVKMAIRNLSGEVVHFNTFSNPENEVMHRSINLSTLPKGIYFVAFRFDNQLIRKKIVKTQ